MKWIILNQSNSYRNHHSECFGKKRAHNKRHTNSTDTPVHLKHNIIETLAIKHALSNMQRENRVKEKRTYPEYQLGLWRVKTQVKFLLAPGPLILLESGGFYWKGMSHLWRIYDKRWQTDSSSLTIEQVSNDRVHACDHLMSDWLLYSHTSHVFRS